MSIRVDPSSPITPFYWTVCFAGFHFPVFRLHVQLPAPRATVTGLAHVVAGFALCLVGWLRLLGVVGWIGLVARVGLVGPSFHRSLRGAS